MTGVRRVLGAVGRSRRAGAQGFGSVGARAGRYPCRAAWEAGYPPGIPRYRLLVLLCASGGHSPAGYPESTHSGEEMQAALLLPSISAEINR